MAQLKAELGFQSPLVGAAFAERAGGEIGGEQTIARRVPLGGVDAIDDAENPVAAHTQRKPPAISLSLKRAPRAICGWPSR